MSDLMKPIHPTPSGFLPEEYLDGIKERRANMIGLAIFGVVMVGVVTAFGVTYRQWHAVTTQQRAVNAEYAAEARKIEQLKTLEQQKAEMLEKAEITSALLERVPRSVLVAELVNRMPDDLRLTEFALVSKRPKEAAKKDEKADPKAKSLAADKKKPAPAAKGKAGEAKAKDAKGAAPPPPPPKPRPPKLEFTLALTGLGFSDQDIADYQTALKLCPLLDRVELVSSVETKVNDVLMRKFRIEAQISPVADARLIQPLAITRDHFAPASPATEKPAAASVAPTQE